MMLADAMAMPIPMTDTNAVAMSDGPLLKFRFMNTAHRSMAVRKTVKTDMTKAVRISKTLAELKNFFIVLSLCVLEDTD